MKYRNVSNTYIYQVLALFATVFCITLYKMITLSNLTVISHSDHFYHPGDVMKEGINLGKLEQLEEKKDERDEKYRKDIHRLLSDIKIVVKDNVKELDNKFEKFIRDQLREKQHEIIDVKANEMEIVKPEKNLNMHKNDTIPENKDSPQKSKKGSDNVEKREKIIWICTGLCFSKNQNHIKIAPMFVKLWAIHTNAKILVNIYYNQIIPELNTYKKVLEFAGAIVVLIQEKTGECVLESQVGRLLSYEHADIHEDDVVMTVDMNGFIKDGKILDPISSNWGEYDVWIYLESDARDSDTSNGDQTLPLHLTAMTAGMWREVMDPDNVRISGVSDVGGFLAYYRKFIKFANLLDSDAANFQYTDRYILTYALLSSHTCTLPRHNGMWHNPQSLNNLSYSPEFDSWDNCWHGGGSRYNHIHKGGNMWFKFSPFHLYQDYLELFEQFSNGIVFKYPVILENYFGLN